jgi:hypothetical protein
MGATVRGEGIGSAVTQTVASVLLSKVLCSGCGHPISHLKGPRVSLWAGQSILPILGYSLHLLSLSFLFHAGFFKSEKKCAEEAPHSIPGQPEASQPL